MHTSFLLGFCLAALAGANARNFRLERPLPIDCEVKYSPWTECDAPCGQGQQRRWGFVTAEPRNGGRLCPELEQSRICDSGLSCSPPPQDCETRFGEWSECSRNCGSGSQRRKGVVLREPRNGGQPCPRLEQERSCNQFECTETNMDCQVWYGKWSACSVSCGGGMQWRRAVVEVPQMGFGKPCPELEQEQSCNQQQCSAQDKDCQVWFGEWSECNKPCGGGFQTRRGVIEQEQVGNGRACPLLEQRQTCNEFIECTDNVVDCQVDYSRWTSCSKPCGGGVRRRWGNVVTAPTNGGRPCGALEQEEACNEDLCAVAVVDCLMRYSEWSSCSASCGGGTQERWGEVVVQPYNGGKPCPPQEETRECNLQQCFQRVDCEINFAEWSQCSSSCGGGSQWRRAVVIVEPMNGGLGCPKLEQERRCNQFECDATSVDCQMWYGEWSTCDQPCGGGQQFRRGVVEVAAQGSGKQCPPEMQYRSCNPFECSEPQPTDCRVIFSSWTECSGPCGGGKRSRWGSVEQESRMGGAPCPALEQEEACNEHLCPQNIQDCVMDFSAWTPCSSDCAGGKQQRWGTVRVQPTLGGQPCPAQEQERDCNANINCIPGIQDCLIAFSAWSACSKPCNGGKRQRWGRITQEPSPGGKPCPELEQEQDCNTQSCQPIQPYRPNFISQIRYMCSGLSGCRTCDFGNALCPADIGLYTSETECRFQCSKPSIGQLFTSLQFDSGSLRPKRRSQPVQPLAPRPVSVSVQVGTKYYCGGADACESCQGKLFSDGQFRSVNCPADVQLFDSEDQCNVQCAFVIALAPSNVERQPGSFKSRQFDSVFRPERLSQPVQPLAPRPVSVSVQVGTKYYCGGADACESCQGKLFSDGQFRSVNCPADVQLFDSEDQCNFQCAFVVVPGSRNVERQPVSFKIRSKRSIRRVQSFPRFPSTQFIPRNRKLVNFQRKPKVPYDCSRKEDGTYPNARAKCSNIFYMCSNGGADEMKCAKNLFYNRETKECDIHAFVPDCSGGRRPATTTPEPRIPVKVTPDPEFDCTKRPNGVFEDPRKKCSPKFYACSNGQTTREVCQDNLFYDTKTNSCLAWASIYKCSGKIPKKLIIKPTKNFFPPKKVPVDCRKLGNGAFPDPRKACSQTWYNCANGNGYEMTCPALTFFNPVLKDCDAFNNIYVCSRRKPSPQIPTPRPPQPKKYPFNCANRDDGFYQAGTCNKFYWACSGGVTEKMPCGKDMVYDIDLKICDFKFNIPKCGGVRPTLPPLIPTKPKQPVNFNCVKRKDGNYAAGKCKPIYYACSGGEANKMQCPHTLFYDSKANSCGNKKYLLECGGKPLPVQPLPRPQNNDRGSYSIRQPLVIQPALPQPFRPQPAPFRPTLKRFQPFNRSQLNRNFQPNRGPSNVRGRNLDFRRLNQAGSGPSAGGVIGGRVQISG